MTSCSKPNCRAVAAVVLAYDYASRRASLHDPPDGDISPHVYALCVDCAHRLRPPKGWTLADERAVPRLFARVGERERHASHLQDGHRQ